MTNAHESCLETAWPQKNQLTDSRKVEMRCWILLLGLLNLGLLLGNIPAENLMFSPDAIANGEWWCLLTWPWVHVSRYHLLLDGAAFLLLYNGLKEQRSFVRCSYLCAAAAGSLLLPLLITPAVSRLGLCGLSGIAHGLMAISAREMIATPSETKVGWLLFAGLVMKCTWELATGSAFLQNLHFGDIGTPIVATHAGGVLGGLLSFRILRNFRQQG